MGLHIDIVPLEGGKAVWNKEELLKLLYDAADQIHPHPEWPGGFHFADGTLKPVPADHLSPGGWIVTVRLGYSEDRMAQIERLHSMARRFGGVPVPPER